MKLPLSLQVEDPDGRRKLVALVYGAVGVPFIVWLWALGGLSGAVLVGSFVPVSSVLLLLLVRQSNGWVWIYPLGVAPLLTCLAGAEVSGQPSLFMALLMGPAGISGLHDSRRSVIASWVFSSVGYVFLALAQNDGPWGYGAAAVASVMHATVSLVVYFKAEQHRCALKAAKKATLEAEAALRVATDAVKTRERFLANMTHELRTPLTGIIGMVQLLPESAEPEIREVMGTINTSANSLLEIVNDVLSFSKGKSGTLELRRAPFTPAAVIRDAVRSIGSQAKQKRLELLLELAPSLPASLMGDELRFRQVIINLVGNALKFTDEGSVTVRALLSDAPASLCVEVEDTGIGIPQERLGSIFEAFVQVDDSDARRFRGTGLGLTITRQLIELMGGSLEVTSELGRGSVFRFRVPLAPAEAALQQPASGAVALETPAGERRSRSGLEVLVAEDNAVNAKVAQGFLSRLGHRSLVARNGVEALRELASRHFDVVLMDMQMPEMDGLEATRRIRATEAERESTRLPIFIVSANALPEDEAAGLASGADAFLRKPIALDRLEQHLSGLVPAFGSKGGGA